MHPQVASPDCRPDTQTQETRAPRTSRQIRGTLQRGPGCIAYTWTPGRRARCTNPMRWLALARRCPPVVASDCTPDTQTPETRAPGTSRPHAGSAPQGSGCTRCTWTLGRRGRHTSQLHSPEMGCRLRPGAPSDCRPDTQTPETHAPDTSRPRAGNGPRGPGCTPCTWTRGRRDRHTNRSGSLPEESSPRPLPLGHGPARGERLLGPKTFRHRPPCKKRSTRRTRQAEGGRTKSWSASW